MCAPVDFAVDIFNAKQLQPPQSREDEKKTEPPTAKQPHSMIQDERESERVSEKRPIASSEQNINICDMNTANTTHNGQTIRT